MSSPHQHVRKTVQHRMKRTRGVHTYHPLTLACNDCGISMLKNASVPYGIGVPCKNQKEYIEWDESIMWLGGDCYCED